MCVEHGKRARQCETHRAGVHVRRCTKLRGAGAEGLRASLELHVDLESDDHLPFHEHPIDPFLRHACASAPRARSSAYAAVNIFISSKCAAMSCPPTGRPSTRPIGCDIAGTPARLAVAVKMSLMYISYGSEIAPILNAVVGAVGVNSASTPLAKTRAKSFAISVRTCCALR